MPATVGRLAMLAPSNPSAISAHRLLRSGTSQQPSCVQLKFFGTRPARPSRYSVTRLSLQMTRHLSRFVASDSGVSDAGLTIRSSRTSFATPTTRQIKLAMLLAPLRTSA
jgi:hypothetical protein